MFGVPVLVIDDIFYLYIGPKAISVIYTIQTSHQQGTLDTCTSLWGIMIITRNIFISLDISHTFVIIWWQLQYNILFDFQDNVIKWKHFPCYCPFVRGIHRSPVNSPHKGQWRGALMFPLICAMNKRSVNNREAGVLRSYRAHYDVIVMWYNDTWRFKINICECLSSQSYDDICWLSEKAQRIKIVRLLGKLRFGGRLG